MSEDQVKLGDGRVKDCHQDKLRPCFTGNNVVSQEMPQLDDEYLTMFTSAPSSAVTWSPDIEIIST